MAANTDLFMEVGSPGTATTLSSPGYTAGVSTSITVPSTTNWPTTTGVVFAMDEVTTVNGEEERVEGTYNEFVGTVASGTQITNVDYVGGDAERSYSAGTTTRVYIPVSAERENRLVEGLLISHDQDGTLKDSAVLPSNLSSGMVAQIVETVSSAVATGTTTIPSDDTIPQNTEGTEFMSLSITPKSATNKLVIEVSATVSTNSPNGIIGALFKDSDANAIAAGKVRDVNGATPTCIVIKHSMVAGSTSAVTFKFRAGPQGAGTLTFNGEGGARLFGATTKSSIVITEYKV